MRRVKVPAEEAPKDGRIACYRQAAIAAREKATTAINPRLWIEIADSWDQLVSHVELLRPPDLIGVGLPRRSRGGLTHSELEK